MTILKQYRVAFSIVVVTLVIIGAIVAIFYARGFKPNLTKGTIERTGLLVANSTPTGANVYIDGRLTSATNTTITYLEPKSYQIRIEKDGYTPWQKQIDINEDLATEIHALMFPLAPEIKPLTTTGASNPTLSPSGTKIAYGVSGARGGVFVLPMETGPFPFRQNARQIATNTNVYDFSKSTFIWDPDSKTLIAHFTDSNGNSTANIILDSEENNGQLRDVTASLSGTINSWQQIITERAQTQATLAPDEVKNATQEAQIKTSPSPSTKLAPKASPNPVSELSNSLVNYFPTGMMFSPSEERILYKNSQGRYKIYDIKKQQESTLPDFGEIMNISWFPDSDHIVIAKKGSISIIETDGNNDLTVYSGAYENGFVFAHPSATRLIILTRLTQQEGSSANLYSINLK